jgi:uncharacterized protein (TIGR00369 family)
MVSEDLLKAWQRPSPILAALGIEFVAAADGGAVIALPFRTEIENKKGNVHGGVLATLADIAMGQAVRSARDGLFSVATVSLSINYLAPGKGDLTATGKCTKFGASLCFAESEIIDADGQVVATATGVFKLLKPSAYPSS